MKKVLVITIVFLGVLVALTVGALVCAKIYAPNYLDNGPSIFNLNKNKDIVSNAPKVKKPVAKTGDSIELNAKSYLVLDRKTLTPLVSHNPGESLPLASITKLMTAIVTLENSNIEDIIEIENDFSKTPEYKLGLYPGEKISVESLLYASLIPSANDAAEALAYYIGEGDYKKFVDMMNAKAYEIGMENTHYSNAVGFDNISNYSTVQDLAYLANYAASKEFIANTVVLSEKTITDASGTISYGLKSTNELLGEKDIKILGMKTGTTPVAGECLVTLAQLKNDSQIIIVILGSQNRFGDTRSLIQWVEENISWE